MTQYHAVMIDETGCEFSAEVRAVDKGQARDMLREMYPESRIDLIEDQKDRDQRETTRWERLCQEDVDDPY